MIKILRRLYHLSNKFYFSLLGLLVKFFVNHSKEIPYDDIIVLGRGKSLNYYFKNYNKFDHIKHVVLTNFNKRDLNRKTILSLNNKIVHFILSSVEPTLSISQILKLNIGKVFYAKPIAMKSDPKTNRKLFRGNKYGVSVDYLPNSIDPYLKFCAGTGLYGIINSIENWNIKNAYLFGFDFYSSDYHGGNQHILTKERVSIFKKPKKEFLGAFHKTHYDVDKPAFLGYVSEKQNVKFLIHTLADLNKKYKNLIFLD